MKHLEYLKQRARKKSPDIKIFALGGLGAVGMNMYVVEVNDEIMIIDAGILFADGEALGVDYIIPNFQYLIENEEKIIGLFITHGHEDHIGGIPFLLKKVKIPAVYASGLALGLIENKISEHKGLNVNFIPYENDSEYNFKNFKVSFFRTNHSIPDSFGIAIKTELGYIIHTGDFKFDFTPVGKKADYYKMAMYGEEGVLCLLADSTNAGIEHFSASEKKIGQSINNIVSQLKGRVIIATFASNVFRVQQIIEASARAKRKVVVFGRSMEKNIDVATKLKYINVPKGTIISQREVDNFPQDKLTILCTGSQGEPLAALSRIANGTHKQIKLMPGDTVVFSSSPIPGNEQFINRTINKLYKAGANIIKNSPLTDTHTTGHASQEELKLMLSLTKPQYFIPIHGEYSMLKKHAEIAVQTGMKKENCFVLDNGDVVKFTKKGPTVTRQAIDTSEVYIDSSLSDVASNILKERKYLADEGLISIIFTIDKNRQMLAPTTMVSRGFIYLKQSEDLANEIKNKATDIFTEVLAGYKILNLPQIKQKVTYKLSQYIYEKTERKPIIVPLIFII